MVAQVTRILFETGCNIADSSMTRLGGEFTVMLVVWLPDGLSTADLHTKLSPVANEMALEHHIKELNSTLALNPNPTQPERECIISVLGADHPGIVYRVADLIEKTGGNISDLYTQVIGSSARPIYSMIIETEYPDNLESSNIETSNNQQSNLEDIQERFDQLAVEMRVEISVRPIQSDPL